MEIVLKEQSIQPVLAIRMRTTIENLPGLIGENYMKIMAYLNELGEQPAFAPYTAYYNLDMQDLDVEMGFPVTKSLPGKDVITAGEIPAGRVVEALYKGPYSQMEASYNEIFKWLTENNLEQTGVYYEYYFNSPDEVPESELLTKIVVPVK